MIYAAFGCMFLSGAIIGWLARGAYEETKAELQRRDSELGSA